MAGVRTAAPPLMNIFRSQLQGQILALVLGQPEREWTIAELADRTGGAYQTVTAEARRLLDGDFARARTIGRTKLLKANRANPYFDPLAQLVTMAFGPPEVLAEEFFDIARIERMELFGSWAARHEGRAGPSPNDIDVLILGNPDRDHVHDALRRSERRLGRSVNATIRKSSDWEVADDAFSRSVKTNPTVVVDGPWTLYRAAGAEVEQGPRRHRAAT
jgi:predicted nucleotidyltransferase